MASTQNSVSMADGTGEDDDGGDKSTMFLPFFMVVDKDADTPGAKLPLAVRTACEAIMPRLFAAVRQQHENLEPEQVCTPNQSHHTHQYHQPLLTYHHHFRQFVADACSAYTYFHRHMFMEDFDSLSDVRLWILIRRHARPHRLTTHAAPA